MLFFKCIVLESDIFLIESLLEQVKSWDLGKKTIDIHQFQGQGLKYSDQRNSGLKWKEEIGRLPNRILLQL